ncbi:hypothetical protein V7S43_016223 [Phytophthora oleae]|uniref:BZIP domain-containing protein n=1 Tax=Phytophthora oleae TaxID=2107226 RepID=A0ABD3EXQ4_9STRA
MKDQIQDLLEELHEAYARIDELQHRLFERQNEDEGDDGDAEPWFVETYSDDNEVVDLTYDSESVLGLLEALRDVNLRSLTLQFASKVPMSSQDQWTTLEAKYATPPIPEDRRMRARRKKNRAQARTRLQARQLRQRVEAQEAAAAADGAPLRVALTQAELEVFRRRYATPPNEEIDAARRLRLNNCRRAERRLEDRTASRRLDLGENEADAEGGVVSVGVAIVEDQVVVSAAVNAAPETIPAVSSASNPPSYDQLAAAVLNLSSDAAMSGINDEDFPDLGQLSHALHGISMDAREQQGPSGGFPTYAQLAEALWTLTPVAPAAIGTDTGFPTYAQLNAALRNLAPEMAIQEAPLQDLLLTNN